MSTLREWQEALQSFVIENEAGVEDKIVKPHEMAVKDRLCIYQNAYYLRLREVLETDFPILCKVMGAQAFDALIRDYLRAYPSQDFSVLTIGKHLASFLRHFPDSDPCYVELAAFEWMMQESIFAKDEPVLRLETLVEIPPAEWGDIQLVLQPSVYLFFCTYNTAERVQKMNEEEIDIGAVKLLKPAPYLMWRKNYEVYFCEITPAQLHLLEGIKKGQDFASLCDSMLVYFSEETVIPWVANTLQSWVKEGVFSNSTFSILVKRPEIFRDDL